MSIILVAHRCGTDKYPEQSLEAARYSLNAGADFVEMDIRLTLDGVPVISHDPDTSRLFGISRNVADYLSDEFLELIYPDHEDMRAHSLEQVLGSGVQPVLFHIKEGGIHLKPIVDLIRKYDFEEKSILGVTATDDIRILGDCSKKIRVLAFMPSPGQTQEFIEKGADIIRLWENWVSQDIIERIHQKGRRVWIMAGIPGTPSIGYASREAAASWISMGIDGILLNEVHSDAASLTRG